MEIKRNGGGAEILINTHTQKSLGSQYHLHFEQQPSSGVYTTEKQRCEPSFPSWSKQSSPQSRLQMSDVNKQLFNYNVFILHLRMYCNSLNDSISV